MLGLLCPWSPSERFPRPPKNDWVHTGSLSCILSDHSGEVQKEKSPPQARPVIPNRTTKQEGTVGNGQE